MPKNKKNYISQKFFYNEKIIVNPYIDLSANLIKLKSNNGHKIKSRINRASDIKVLPMIRRTGTGAPWMYGHVFSFSESKITDPDLQRTGSIFMTTETAIEDFALLLLRILDFLSLKHIDVQNNVKSSNLIDELASKIDFENNNLIKELKNIITTTKENKEEVLTKISTLLENIIQSNPGIHKKIGIILKEIKNRKKLLCDSEFETLTSTKNNISDLFEDLILSFMHSINSFSNNTKHLDLSWIDNDFEEQLIVQGLGDLSMNERNVAFWANDNKQEIFCPENEPISERRYYCLISWVDPVPNDKKQNLNKVKDNIHASGIGISLQDDLCIARLHFLNGKPFIKTDCNDPKPINDLVDFAVYGKIIIRNGEIVKKREVIDEYSDIRHIFKLPNLNIPGSKINDIISKTIDMIKKKWNDEKPNIIPITEDINNIINNINKENIHTSNQKLLKIFESLWGLKSTNFLVEDLTNFINITDSEMNDLQRHLIANSSEIPLNSPRNIFGKCQFDDVWLMEKELIEDSTLRRSACDGPVSFKLSDLGAPKSLIELSLLMEGYKKQDFIYNLKKPGDFTWISDSNQSILSIWLIENTYPCTIVGIGNDNEEDSKSDGKYADTLFIFAWGHDFSWGRTIWDCAEMLHAQGAKYALVLDEGQDVFQCHIKGEKELQKFIKAEKNCQPLKKWMPVPLAFGSSMVDNETVVFHKRKGLRASIAFWTKKY